MRLTDALVNRLKAYIVFTFLDSSRNKSGKSQPIWTKVGTHAQVKGRQRSRNFGRDRLSGAEIGTQKCLRRWSFLSAIRDDFSATLQMPIFATFGHDT